MTPAAVVVSGLTRRFPGRAAPAVADVSLTVSPGSILALLGPSGAGKTTLLRLIAGFERADSGSVAIGGHVVSGPGVHEPPERRPVGFVFQNSTLFPHLDVRHNIAFGLKHLAAIARARCIEEVAALCEIEPLLHRHPHELSGGEHQRAALARALARNTSVVLLDEPMSNVDVQLRADLGAQLRAILCNAHATAILVTHDHEDAFALADTMGVMQAGRLEQLSEPETIYARPANAFVGRFVGAANFLPAHITAHGIETEIHTFPLNGMAGTSGRCDAMLRPGELRLVPDPQGNARILQVRFLGSVHVYAVRLPSGLVLRCEMDARLHGALEPGDAVRVLPLISCPRCFPSNY
ncbi:MAG: ABC transporter ATP-binding protein [Longimicrobiales bacterium]